ncbi:SCO family protein [Wenyingzhuangia sp. IMCC45574]
MNSKFFAKSKYTFIAMGALSVVIISYLYYLNNQAKSLPIYNPIDINPRLVDESLLNKSKNHVIGSFELTDQNGKKVTEKNFEDKIYVADFFFTRCGTICPIMTTNMTYLQNKFKDNPKVKFLSHSVTPVMDSVPVLKSYAEAHGAISGKWHITTGDKKVIYNLARKNYFAVLDEGDGGAQDFIHTEQFVLIDTQKRIRGFYDGTQKKEVDQVVKDILLLLEAQ